MSSGNSRVDHNLGNHSQPSIAAVDQPGEPSAWPWGRGWILAAVVGIILTATLCTLSLVWDSDVFWHLAAGDWMLRHGQVLGHDPFSIDPQPQWVNIHWLFQVILALLHRAGGFALLSVMTAAVAGATLGAFALALKRHVHPALLILCSLAILITIAGRVRTRPETFTLAYLTVTMLLLDHVRRGGSARWLWWLPVVQWLWVNMHGLFILGVGLMWVSLAAAGVDRLLRRGRLSSPMLSGRVVAPMIVATAVCLLTPWPIQAALHPFLLWTRVSGQQAFYTYGVQELQPTLVAWQAHLGSLALSAATAAVMLLNVRRLPMAHVLWLLPLAALALLARRNVALIGPPCGILLALHGQQILSDIVRRFPRWLTPAATATALLLAGAMTLANITGASARANGSVVRFGAGLLPSEFPIDTARWLADSPAQGDLLTDDFGSAGTFMYYSADGRSRPNRLLFMDGRLEVHSLDRFIRQHRIHQDLQRFLTASAVELPPSVRFVYVGFDNLATLAAMSACQSHGGRFELVRVNPEGACFADTRWPQRSGQDDPLSADTLNLADYDRPLERSGRVAGAALGRRTWYSQNPVSTNRRLGEVFLALGQPCLRGSAAGITAEAQADIRGVAYPIRYRCSLLAIRYLATAAQENITSAYVASGLLAMALENRAFGAYFERSAALPVQAELARAIHLFATQPESDVNPKEYLRIEMVRVRGEAMAGKLDSAYELIQEVIDRLPSALRVNPPAELSDLRDEIRRAYDGNSKLANDVAGIKDLSEQVQAYMHLGMHRRAIAALEGAAALSADQRLLLGDLLLLDGKTDAALAAYDKARTLNAPEWSVELRRGLVQYVLGDVHEAADRLARLAEASNQPSVRFYLATIREELGDYAAARSAIAAASSDDPQFAQEIVKLQQRLDRMQK